MIRLLLSALLVCFSCPVGAANWSAVVPMYNAAGGAAPSWGVGNLLSERFTGTGTEETWASPTTENGGTWNPDATTVSGTGFDGDHLTVSGSSNWQANSSSDMGSAQSAVYFRLFLRVNSEDFGDGNSEFIFNIVADGASMGVDSGIGLVLYQDAGSLHLGLAYNGSASVTTGATHTTISSGTIYKVEGKFVDNGSSDEVEWLVDDVSIGSRSGALVSSLALRDVHIGMTYGPGASISFDTIDIDSAGFPDD